MTWRLHVLCAADELHTGAIYQLKRGDTVIGREPSPGSSGLAFDDLVMSREHLRLRVRGGGDAVEITDLDSRNGSWVGGRRVQQARVGHGAVLRAGGLVAVLESDAGHYPDDTQPTLDVPGGSAVARQIRGDLRRAAADDHPVLIVGPTGSGKEYAATELHRRSGRRGRLVRVNITAIPDTLFESELFGHVKGAFSGAAAARPGRFREADGGTLVLDEIGDLALPLQSKLLRALEESTVRPVGGSSDESTDVRVVAATNADLDALIKTARFRRDLAARLRTHVIEMPALPARKPDLLDLADAVQPLRHRDQPKRWRDALTPDAVEALLLHDWPDNLRGLKAALVRASAWESGGRIGMDGLPAWVLDQVRQRLSPAVVAGARAALDDAAPADLPTRRGSVRPSAEEMIEALRRHRGNIEAVAREFGVFHRQVYRWLRCAGIERADLERYRV